MLFFCFLFIITRYKNKIVELKSIKKPIESKFNMPMVNQLRNVLNIRNRFLIPNKLFDLIKFEVNQHVQKPKPKMLKSTTINDKNLKTFKIIILITFIIMFFTVIFSLCTERLS